MVRYIITCISQARQSSLSDNTQRWILIGWILRYCKNNQLICAEIKQAIFFDWINFNKGFDNTLYIEPGVLIITQSSNQYADLTMELIEFLSLYAENFDPTQQESIKKSIRDIFWFCEHKVFSSLSIIRDNVKIKEDIKKLFDEILYYGMQKPTNNEIGVGGIKTINPTIPRYVKLNNFREEIKQGIINKDYTNNNIPINVYANTNLSTVKQHKEGI